MMFVGYRRSHNWSDGLVHETLLRGNEYFDPTAVVAVTLSQLSEWQVPCKNDSKLNFIQMIEYCRDKTFSKLHLHNSDV